MPKKIPEVPTPDKPTKSAWLRRFTHLVETELRSSPTVRPRQAGKTAAAQLRAEWSQRFPDVAMPQGWIAI